MAEEHPILFSDPMVLEILAGRKTETRRIVRNAVGSFWDHAGWTPTVVAGGIEWSDDEHRWCQMTPNRCPYGMPGDSLWVRERMFRGQSERWYYSADGSPVELRADDPKAGAALAWLKGKVDLRCPSIHMPRWACRIILKVEQIRVQRLWEIRSENILAEGVVCPLHAGACGCSLHREAWEKAWDSINGERGPWVGNPWVWAVKFEREERRP